MSFSIGRLRLPIFTSSSCTAFHFHPALSPFWLSMCLFRMIFSSVLTLISRFSMNFPSTNFLNFGSMRPVFSFIRRLRKFFCFRSWGLCFLFTNRSPSTHIYLFPWWKPLLFFAANLWVRGWFSQDDLFLPLSKSLISQGVAQVRRLLWNIYRLDGWDRCLYGLDCWLEFHSWQWLTEDFPLFLRFRI